MGEEKRICPLLSVRGGKTAVCVEGRCAWWWYQPDVGPKGACIVHWLLVGMSGIKQAIEASPKQTKSRV